MGVTTSVVLWITTSIQNMVIEARCRSVESARNRHGASILRISKATKCVTDAAT
jgi:hypothetical protein